MVVLAAGLGKRMKSARPKVLHEVCGRPSLWHVLRAAAATRPERLAVVVSKERPEVAEAAVSWGLRPAASFVDQGEPLGTGHAVAAAKKETSGAADVLVLAGDDPLVTAGDLRRLLAVHRRTGAAATIGTTLLADPTGYGRVIRRGNELVEIVQEVDASAEVRRVHEVSTLVYAFRREALFRVLPGVGRQNRQREYYLPDVVSLLRAGGERVGAVTLDFGGAMGLNSRRGLADVSRVMRARIVAAHEANGVTFVDPSSAFVDVDVRIGAESVIGALTFLEGATRIGAGCSIGPSTRIVESTVADGADVTFSVVRGARVGRDASVGPFASLRPGTVIEEGAKAGTFVELKATRVGAGSKVPHLSYMGDATIGRGVNVGAGSITCNYDGYDKRRTVIGNEAFIGSDTMLIAPVTIGRRAWTAAGSAVSKDVPAGALAVERAEQRAVRGYDERKRRAHGGRAPGGGGQRGGRGGG